MIDNLVSFYSYEDVLKAATRMAKQENCVMVVFSIEQGGEYYIEKYDLFDKGYLNEHVRRYVLPRGEVVR